MSPWRLREFHDDDLDQAISVWDQSRGADEPHPVFCVSEVIAAAKSGQPAVVGVVGDELVGMAVAQQHGERAWISMVALSNRWRNRGIGSALLAELEVRLRALGARRISALLPADATGTTALRNSGYTERSDLRYFEKLDHVGPSDAGLLAELGGQVMPHGLWQAMAGMETMPCCKKNPSASVDSESGSSEQCCISIPQETGSSGTTFNLRPPSFSVAVVHPAVLQSPLAAPKPYECSHSTKVFLPNLQASYIRNLSLLI